MTVKDSPANTELEMIEFLSQKTRADARSEHLLALLDTFMHEGPNGMHRCLFFEAMGPSAALMIEDLQENKPMYYGKMRPRYPKWMAKTMLVHILRGLAFLHENGVAHRDVQPGMPAALRAPELIVGKPLGTAIDIWAFGCLMFEFLAARALFAVMTFGWDEQERNDADDFQFIQFYKVIGKLPDSIINAWPRASKYFNPVSGVICQKIGRQRQIC